MRKLVYLILLIAAVSCKPLSEDLLNKAERLKREVESKKDAISSGELLYLTAIANKPYLTEAVQKEDLVGYYKKASNVLSGLYVNIQRVDKLVNKNTFDDESLLNAELTDVEAKLATIDELIQTPVGRVEVFYMFYNNYQTYKATNDTSFIALRDSIRSSNRFSKITMLKYKQKAESISKQMLEIELYFQDAARVRDSFLLQYKLRVKDTLKFNLKKYVDSYSKYQNTESTILDKIYKFKNHLCELDLSYTKILDDTDADFYLTIARTSWNESSDSNTDEDYSYDKIEVSEEVFEYFDRLDDNAVIVDFNNNWGATSTVHIDDKIWNDLKINVQERFPSSHNYAEFWVKETEVKYYHKYLTERNGKLDSTDYILVNESDYYKYEDAEGLAIFSKDIGNYYAEADTIPSIPGISQVGNSAYGEWRDSVTNMPTQHVSHGSYWYFYRPYGYYNTWGSHFYYHNYTDYNTSYRNRTSYYGGVSSEQHYKSYNTSRGRSESSFRNGRGYRGGGPGGGGK